MNKYGILAVNTAKRLAKTGGNPVNEWNKQAAKLFGKATSIAKKSCPKTTFLSLCEFDIVKGIKSGNYTNSEINKRHAYDAAKYLLESKEKNIAPHELWKIITKNKTHNSQMDVICGLYEMNLLTFK